MVKSLSLLLVRAPVLNPSWLRPASPFVARGLPPTSCPGRQRYLFPAFQFILGTDIADRTVKANLIVMGHIARHNPLGVFQTQRGSRSNRFSFDGPVEPFDLAVTLWIIRAGPHVRHATDADVFLEVLGHKLRSVVGNDSWLHAGKPFPGPLQNRFHIRLGHRLSDFPVDDVPTVPVQDTAQIVERPGDVQVSHIHVPVVVGLLWGHKPGPFLGRLGVVPVQQPGPFEHPIHARRADRHHVRIQHHEGQSPIPFQRILLVVLQDGLLFLVCEPVIPRDPSVVLVDLAVPRFPVVPFARGQGQP